MSTTTCFLIILLSLYGVTCARIHPLMHQALNQAATPDVISKACEKATEKELCVTVLKTTTDTDVTDLKQAAFAAIQTAASEASATSDLIKAARKREENKEVVEDGIEEETLADCAMSYLGLVERLGNARNALMAGPETEVLIEIKEATTTAELCDKSIAGGKKSTMVEEVAKKNDHVRKLCSNALSVYNVYATGQ